MFYFKRNLIVICFITNILNACKRTTKEEEEEENEASILIQVEFFFVKIFCIMSSYAKYNFFLVNVKMSQFDCIQINTVYHDA